MKFQCCATTISIIISFSCFCSCGCILKLGGGFTYFLFPPLFGEDEPILTNIFSNGLVQPPTSKEILSQNTVTTPKALHPSSVGTQSLMPSLAERLLETEDLRLEDVDFWWFLRDFFAVLLNGQVGLIKILPKKKLTPGVGLIKPGGFQ